MRSLKLRKREKAHRQKTIGLRTEGVKREKGRGLTRSDVKRSRVKHLDIPLGCVETGLYRSKSRRYHLARFRIRSRALDGKLPGVKKL